MCSKGACGPEEVPFLEQATYKMVLIAGSGIHDLISDIVGLTSRCLIVKAAEWACS